MTKSVQCHLVDSTRKNTKNQIQCLESNANANRPKRDRLPNRSISLSSAHQRPATRRILNCRCMRQMPFARIQHEPNSDSQSNRQCYCQRSTQLCPAVNRWRSWWFRMWKRLISFPMHTTKWCTTIPQNCRKLQTTKPFQCECLFCSVEPTHDVIRWLLICSWCCKCHNCQTHGNQQQIELNAHGHKLLQKTYHKIERSN